MWLQRFALCSRHGRRHGVHKTEWQAAAICYIIHSSPISAFITILSPITIQPSTTSATTMSSTSNSLSTLVAVPSDSSKSLRTKIAATLKPRRSSSEGERWLDGEYVRSRWLTFSKGDSSVKVGLGAAVPTKPKPEDAQLKMTREQKIKVGNQFAATSMGGMLSR
jgi:hypothetical protein